MLSAAFVRDVPVEVVQPDGSSLKCLSSGDEFYNWLHDKAGFTIIQSPTTGYYTYANLKNGELLPTKLIAGKDVPRSHGLTPGLNIDEQSYFAIRQQYSLQQTVRTGEIIGTMNNIDIYVRFSGDTEFNLLRTDQLERHWQALLTTYSPVNEANGVSINPIFSWIRSGLTPRVTDFLWGQTILPHTS